MADNSSDEDLPSLELLISSPLKPTISNIAASSSFRPVNEPSNTNPRPLITILQRFKPTFRDGDPLLEQFPGDLLRMLKDDCKARQSNIPECALSGKGGCKNAANLYKGRKAIFVNEKQNCILHTARFKWLEKKEIFIVRNPRGGSPANGDTVALVWHSRANKTTVFGGQEMEQHKYRVWVPHSVKGDSFEVVWRLIELDKSLPDTTNERVAEGETPVDEIARAQLPNSADQTDKGKQRVGTEEIISDFPIDFTLKRKATRPIPHIEIYDDDRDQNYSPETRTTFKRRKLTIASIPATNTAQYPISPQVELSKGHIESEERLEDMLQPDHDDFVTPVNIEVSVAAQQLDRMDENTDTPARRQKSQGPTTPASVHSFGHELSSLDNDEHKPHDNNSERSQTEDLEVEQATTPNFRDRTPRQIPIHVAIPAMRPNLPPTPTSITRPDFRKPTHMFEFKHDRASATVWRKHYGTCATVAQLFRHAHLAEILEEGTGILSLVLEVNGVSFELVHDDYERFAELVIEPLGELSQKGELTTVTVTPFIMRLCG